MEDRSLSGADLLTWLETLRALVPGPVRWIVNRRVHVALAGGAAGLPPVGVYCEVMSPAEPASFSERRSERRREVADVGSDCRVAPLAGCRCAGGGDEPLA